MGSFDQNDAPKTCGLPVTVATPHGTGSGLTAGEEDLEKMESISFHWSSPALHLFSPPLLESLMNVGYVSFYSFMCLTLWAQLQPNQLLQTKKTETQSWRHHSKSSLYGPLLLSVESIDLIDKYGAEPQDFTLTVHLILRLILKRMSTFCTDTKRHNQLFVLPDLETLVFQLVN